jgi:hypothetical protein
MVYFSVEQSYFFFNHSPHLFFLAGPAEGDDFQLFAVTLQFTVMFTPWIHEPIYIYAIMLIYGIALPVGD